jgi:UDP-glucose 4-epimerase
VNCLVTGGAGFIGHNLVRTLLNEGHSVRVLDNYATGKRKNLDPYLNLIDHIEGDLRNFEVVREAAQDIEVIFHQGALGSVPRSIQDPLTSNQVNVNGTLHVLEAARHNGVRRVVYASSSSVYGHNPALPKNESMDPAPVSPYAVSKVAGEQYCRVFTHVYGLETVALRYFNVFGPGQDPDSAYAAVMPLFTTGFLNGTPITVDGDGEQSRDFTFIDNVVHANLCAANAADASGGAFNIACGQRTTLNQVLDHLRTMTEVNTEIVYGPDRPGDVRHSLADIGRAQTALNYTPSVPLEAGLRSTVEYYRSIVDNAG